MLKASAQPFTRQLLILDSCQAILALAPLLESLAERCGQPAAMHWLSYFLHPGTLGKRKPRFVLFLTPEEDKSKSLSVDDLQAAALFYEYEVAGIRSGVVATADAVGFSSVIAPAGQRGRVAALAARALMERGARMLLATFDEEAQTPEVKRILASCSGVRWGQRGRHVARMLPLRPSFEATLTQMGKSTRFNLRYYRRRLVKEVPCEYVADAASHLDPAELSELNANCLNPVPPDEFMQRIACASHLPGSFLCGLRSADGRWLSLIGGWRQADTTVLHWQLNATGFEKHSIGTVMRSFFLEAEGARGARKLLIYGGTPHSMHHAFQKNQVTDLVLERNGLRTAILQFAARHLLNTRWNQRGNFVLETLCQGGIHWHSELDVPNAGKPRGFEPIKQRRIA